MIRSIGIAVALTGFVGASYFAMRTQTRTPTNADSGETVQRVDSVGGADELSFGKKSIDLGQITTDDEHLVSIPIENVSESEVRIERISTTCSCLSANGGVGITLAPKESGAIEMRLRPKPRTGRWPLVISLSTGQMYRFILTGQAYRDIRLSADEQLLQGVLLGEEAVRTVSILSDQDDVKLAAPIASADWLKVDLTLATEKSGPKGPRRIANLNVTLKPAKTGPFHERVTIPVTTSNGNRELILSLKGTCTVPVSFFPGSIRFSKGKQEESFVIKSNHGKLAILSIDAPPSLKVSPSTESPSTVFKFSVKCTAELLSLEAPPKHIRVTLEGEKRHSVEIPVFVERLTESDT